MALSPSVLQALVNYDWPGNIRALRHAIERAVILSENEQFKTCDFQLDINSIAAPTDSVTPATKNIDPELNLEQLERKTIHRALKKNRYNISHTAKELGLTRAALYRRMEKYDF